MGPVTRARAKGLQNLVSRVLLDDLGADEACWVNSFTIHAYGNFNRLHLSMPQEESAKDANGAEEGKLAEFKAGLDLGRQVSRRPLAGVHLGRPQTQPAPKAGSLYPAFFLREFLFFV